MQATQKVVAISVEDYLQDELLSQERHEYVGGAIYAMAGTSDAHNEISLNLAVALRTHLRGKPCRAYMADVKLRLRIAEDDMVYYPDVMVTCDERDTHPYFKRFPQVLIEVLSPETERTDRREKFLSYIQIESLQEYTLVAQDKMQVTIFRRASKWQPEILERPQEVLNLPSLGFTLPLAAVYEEIRLQL